jgi:hypothetical protein
MEFLAMCEPGDLAALRVDTTGDLEVGRGKKLELRSPPKQRQRVRQDFSSMRRRARPPAMLKVARPTGKIGAEQTDNGHRSPGQAVSPSSYRVAGQSSSCSVQNGSGVMTGTSVNHPQSKSASICPSDAPVRLFRETKGSWRRAKKLRVFESDPTAAERVAAWPERVVWEAAQPQSVPVRTLARVLFPIEFQCRLGSHRAIA